MTTPDIINIAGTIVLCAALWRQVEIILDTDWRSKWDFAHTTKIIFPVFNILVILMMWLPYINQILWSSICFLIAAFIAAYTYWSPIFKRKK